MELHHNLQQYIKGSIFIEHNKKCDSLHITIHSDLTPFRFKVDNIQHKISVGYTTQDLTITVLNLFRKYVLKNFFV